VRPRHIGPGWTGLGRRPFRLEPASRDQVTARHGAETPRRLPVRRSVHTLINVECLHPQRPPPGRFADGSPGRSARPASREPSAEAHAAGRRRPLTAGLPPRLSPLASRSWTDAPGASNPGLAVRGGRCGAIRPFRVIVRLGHAAHASGRRLAARSARRIAVREMATDGVGSGDPMSGVLVRSLQEGKGHAPAPWQALTLDRRGRGRASAP
jgi:hypothetical protein